MTGLIASLPPRLANLHGSQLGWAHQSSLFVLHRRIPQQNDHMW